MFVQETFNSTVADPFQIHFRPVSFNINVYLLNANHTPHSTWYLIAYVVYKNYN